MAVESGVWPTRQGRWGDETAGGETGDAVPTPAGEPGVRRARARYGGCLTAVCLLAAGGCGGTPAAPTPVYRATVFITYEGLVFEPYNRKTRRSWGDIGITPLPGARVRIIGGQPDGWTTVTDAEGRFSFEDYPFCELESAECRSRRFRVEKAEYETREVGASDPYRYRSGSDLDLDYSPYEKRVPMSREWPANAQIQRMLRELPAMRPLWLSVVDRGTLSGAYGGGHMWVGSLMPQYLVTLAHEYCHAHQDWVDGPVQLRSVTLRGGG